MWKYFLAWFPMLIIAILNGTLRDLWYGKHISELHAHQVSTALAVLLFGVYIWTVLRLWKPVSSRQAFAIGILWLCLTLAFEFGFFHYVMGHPWSELFHAYNIFAGRVWVVILLWITFAPYGFYRLQLWSPVAVG